MRIVLDATSCAKERAGGIGTYGRELVAGLRRVAPELELVIGLRPNRWTRRELVADLCAGTGPRLLVEGLVPLLAGRPIDLFHGVGIRLPAGGRFPKVVMMHDVNVFEFPELSRPAWREKRQRRIRQTAARATLMIAYSEQGRDALVEHLGVDPGRVRVVPLGVDTSRFRPHTADELKPLLARHDLGDRPYVVWVGQDSPRKNHDGLLEAFVAADLPAEWVLVLGGPRGDGAERLRARAAALGLAEERLRLPGWVSDEDLPGLLSGAALCVCPSLHEGFGLPVVEAQAAGTAVAASDRGALAETLGDCGLGFDPTDGDAFAGVLRQLADDPALRDDLARRGPARVAAAYTWDHVARATLAVWREAAAS